MMNTILIFVYSIIFLNNINSIEHNIQNCNLTILRIDTMAFTNNVLYGARTMKGDTVCFVSKSGNINNDIIPQEKIEVGKYYKIALKVLDSSIMLETRIRARYVGITMFDKVIWTNDAMPYDLGEHFKQSLFIATNVVGLYLQK